jgi:Domain of unknown function (DUF4115)
VATAAALVLLAGVVVGVVFATTGGSGTNGRGHKSESAAKHPPKPPPVTVPAVVHPTAFSATEASYSTPASDYSVVVHAAQGECWIKATNLSNGAVVWQGLIASGNSQTITATGGLQVELGAASAAEVTLNGTPIALPPGFHSPFLVNFAPT